MVSILNSIQKSYVVSPWVLSGKPITEHILFSSKMFSFLMATEIWTFCMGLRHKEHQKTEIWLVWISDFWHSVFASPLDSFFIFQECQSPFAALLRCWLPRFSVLKEFTLPWERRETKQRCWVILQISWIVLLEITIFVSLSFRCRTLNFRAGSKHRTLW